jgi:hypothetical protein
MSPQDLRIAVHFLCGFGFVRLLYPDGDEVDVAFPQRRPRGFDDLAIHAVTIDARVLCAFGEAISSDKARNI